MALTTAPSLRMRMFSLIFLLRVTFASGKADVDTDGTECGLWLGPSSIKAKVEHGFGLGMFTGKTIAKGDVMPAELLVPIYDWDYKEHPPLREYVWDAPEGPSSDMVLESFDSMLMFVPGLASVAPCTSVNFNLKLNHTIAYDNWGAGQSNPATPSAGAFSYRTNAMFTAVRDILPGEELVVECEDDDFDASKIPSPKINVNTQMCLDDTLEVKPLSIHGKGLFTKRNIPQADTILLSTPMIPIHRDELKMENSQTQLLLNYCYGHPESVLLWLPHGPLINSINHSTSRKPNARIQWRSIDDTTDDDIDDADDDDDIPMDDKTDDKLLQRERFHHPETLQADPEEVANVHGIGLVMDLIATQPIYSGEEVVIDYGDAWVTAWNSHQAKWSKQKEEKFDLDHPIVLSAHTYNQLYKDDEIFTALEQHDKDLRYPPNIQTACYFEIEWAGTKDFQEDVVTYESWKNQKDHSKCLLPCIVMERSNNSCKNVNGDGDGDDDDDANDDANANDDSDDEINEACFHNTYTAQLIDSHHAENVSVDWNCHLFRKYEYIYTDIPREGIIFVEKPHKSDVWRPEAFRHSIGVPDDANDKMYPDVWKKRNLRRRGAVQSMDTSNSDAFKRKSVTTRQDALDAIQIKMSPRNDL